MPHDERRGTHAQRRTNNDQRTRSIAVFTYGTLRANGVASELLDGCERLREATVRGTLFDIDGRFPALMLYGSHTVHGEIWRCPPDRLLELDAYEAVAEGLFRRVGVEVDGVGCWTYVAGPGLAARLRPEHCITRGRWPDSGARTHDRAHDGARGTT